MRKTPNPVERSGIYPHFDERSLWAFILDSLGALNRQKPIDAISVTTHGATAALLDAAGGLALPILDYEHDGPDTLAAEYDAVRPPFAESGTPRLPIGLNLGAQLFWQARTFPDDFARVASILTYPQYWAFRLSGVRCKRGDVARLPHRPVEFSRARFLEPRRSLGLARADGAGAAGR